MNHTKEPWSQGDIIKELVFSETGESVIAKCMKMDESEDGDQEANAKRIVACVNACADVDDERLSLGYVKELEERVESQRLTIEMQNLTISKLTEPSENGGYSGTSIPLEDV